MTTPSDRLVENLIHQTEAGTLNWEPANLARTAFIAKAKSGTVTVNVGFGGGLSADLIVRDAHGAVIQRINAMSGFHTPMRGPAVSASTGGRVAHLAELVANQDALKDAQIDRLADEFEL